MKQIITSIIIVTALPILAFLTAPANAQTTYHMYKVQAGSVVTRNDQDLLILNDLNTTSVQSKVRAFLKKLETQDSALVLHKGDVVRVSQFYPNQTAQIVFGNHTGYIAKADLIQPN